MFLVDGKEIVNKSDDEEDLIFDHTSLLNKDTRMRDFSNGCCPTGGKLQIARTVNLCLSFFGLGLCFAIPTATLDDLQKAVQADENIKNIYTARYSGYLFGALIGGFLFDRYNRQFLLFLSLLATGVGILVMPFCQKIAALMACTAVTGITMGFLDTGGNVWCLDLWGRKSAPIMQTLHFCFGLGAFVAPIVAEPFLSPHSPQIISFGNDSLFNASYMYNVRVGMPHTSFQGNKHAIVKHSAESFYNLYQLDEETILSRFKHEINESEWDTSSSENITAVNETNFTTGTPSNISQFSTIFHLNSTTTTTVKPKPLYADGNQLKQKGKWDFKPHKDQKGNLVMPPDETKSSILITTIKPMLNLTMITTSKSIVSSNLTLENLAKNKSAEESDFDTNESLSADESTTDNSTANVTNNATTFENTSSTVEFIQTLNSSIDTSTDILSNETTTKILPFSATSTVSELNKTESTVSLSETNMSVLSETNKSVFSTLAPSTAPIEIANSNILNKTSDEYSMDKPSSITTLLQETTEQSNLITSTSQSPPASTDNISNSLSTTNNEIIHAGITKTTTTNSLSEESLIESSTKMFLSSTGQVEEIIEHPNDSRKLLNDLTTNGFISTTNEDYKNINMLKEAKTETNNDAPESDNTLLKTNKSPKYYPQTSESWSERPHHILKNVRVTSAQIAQLIKTTSKPETIIQQNNFNEKNKLETTTSNLNLATDLLENENNLSNEGTSTESATEKSDKSEKINDIFNYVFELLHKNRLSRFEIPYILLAVYIFVVASVFLVFLCKNPREPRSRQLEELSRSRDVSLSFQVVMVGLMSLFLCLYVGIEVGVGELLETFATKETLQLSQARGYFLPYLFWGSFVAARGVSIFIATRVTGRCMLLTNLTVCLIASVMLVAGADKLEALLWIGVVVLGAGMAPLFPTSISWLEHYLHITNKTASIFVLGAAIGELIIPIVIDTFINQEPMVLMYVNIIVNALCFITFIILCVMASKHSEKYQNKPKRSMYQLASSDDYEDVTELVPNRDHSNGYHLPIKRKLPPIT